MRNHRESHFLRLPGEVRNRIYNYALGRKHILILPPRLYSADRNGTSDHLPTVVEPNTIRKLLHLTETCRQIHAETNLLVFEMNDFRIPFKYSFDYFVKSVSQRQMEAIRTLVWPRRCEQMADDLLSRFTGLQRFVVVTAGRRGEDFYIPTDNATVKVHSWYSEKRLIAKERLDAWRAKGIEIEYCE